jgi:hypothetical protein
MSDVIVFDESLVRFGRFAAMDGLSMTVRERELCGLLSPRQKRP